ncbi:SLC13 family permease [Dongia deserti]|uniref:SLC13 family permease n=1 Tax=Dongia deserti TaxID=2268030 RepID=UPI000E65CC2D|nr:SLC13 family permease [Dongia deserti]
MTLDQVLLFVLFALILGAMMLGRIRHDLAAAGGLLAAVLLGLVSPGAAFSGFSNHAVIIVALVLVASRAFENSGALGLPATIIARESRPVGRHIGLTGGLGAILSAVINNVAALALLMPIDIEAARKAGRPRGMTLMPLSFATILGGMVTLIGTPPNVIAAAIRNERLGQSYHMFDFTPVGLSVAVAGVLFVALIGWRLVPHRMDQSDAPARHSSFRAELWVPADSPAVGRTPSDLDQMAERAEVLILGLVRGGKRYDALAHVMEIAPADIMVVEGATDAIAAFIKAAGLQEPHGGGEGEGSPNSVGEAMAEAGIAGGDTRPDDLPKEDTVEEPQVIEAVVRADSRLIGRSAQSVALRSRFGLTLVGISRAGTVARQKVGERVIRPGDMLLLTSSRSAAGLTLNLLGLLPINQLGIARFRPLDAALAIGLFAAAIAAATVGLTPFTIAIAIAVVAYAALGLVPAREFYEQIDWSVIVMLACLLPIGAAFEQVGGAALVADGITRLTGSYGPVVALVALMIATMTLSDMLNNVATIVVAGPIAIDVAQRLEVNPDTFLMGVAVAASCAFLTPIGHKNNTLIMGPGGFRFSDYWRMGLPLELVVLTVAVPALLIFWPL